ncbi:MAG: hypothetical protein ACWGMZ_11650, partial [Thermoguttaceae bacterium]
MSFRKFFVCVKLCRLLSFFALGVLTLAVQVDAQQTATTTTLTQYAGLPVYVQQVGGVAIDPEGIVENVQADVLGRLAKLRGQGGRHRKQG